MAVGVDYHGIKRQCTRISIMSGISRFFAPAKGADGPPKQQNEDGPAKCADGRPSPKQQNEDGSEDESVTAGIELDKDGWQIFPQGVASAKSGGSGSDVVCIDIDDSEEDDDEAVGDQRKVDAKVQAQTTAPMPEILAQSDASPANQGDAAFVQDIIGKESSPNDNVGLVRDIAKDRDADECEANAEIHATNNADEASIGINSNETNADATTSGTDVLNPFASFAFGSGDAPPVGRRNDKPKRPNSMLDVPTQERSTEKNGSKKIPQGKQKDNKKRRRTSTKNKCDGNDYVPVCQLSKEQQEEIRAKWQSLGDPNESLEVRRFQVLVAARLHAQSREPIVRAAMDNLRNYFGEKEDAADGGGLNAKNLSKADPKEIAKQIPSILFANVKAEHIVKAAKEICSRFGGIVPQGTHGLKEITGIGPKLADILAFANSHKAYGLLRANIT